MKKKIVILSVALGSADSLSKTGLDTILQAEQLFLTSEKQAITNWLKKKGLNYETMDRFYEQYEDFDLMQSEISSYLWQSAEKGTVTYLVSDILSDRSVLSLYRSKPEEAVIECMTGNALLESYLPLIAPYLHGNGLLTVSAYSLNGFPFLPDQDILITELDNSILAGDTKLFLSDVFPEDSKVLFMSDEKESTEIALYEIDRQTHFDHRTAVFIPGTPFISRSRIVFNDLPSLVRKDIYQPSEAPQNYEELLVPFRIAASDVCSRITEKDAYGLSDSIAGLLLQTLRMIAVAEKHDEFHLCDVLDSIYGSLKMDNPDDR